MWLRQDGLSIGSPGAPVVHGDGQTGIALAIGGFAPGYTVRPGQYFSIITAGRRYLYLATASTSAASDGTMTLPIFPMLRVSPSAGDTCEFAKPYIQGSLSGNEAAWSRLGGGWSDFGSITISEDA
jgi:hypothetical protein